MLLKNGPGLRRELRVEEEWGFGERQKHEELERPGPPSAEPV
jgi:hypothetical protein